MCFELITSCDAWNEYPEAKSHGHQCLGSSPFTAIEGDGMMRKIPWCGLCSYLCFQNHFFGKTATSQMFSFFQMGSNMVQPPSGSGLRLTGQVTCSLC